jgi:hypothetical protein
MAETFIAAKKDGLQVAINVGCGRHAVEIRFEAGMDDASDPSADRERGLNENEAVALAEQILRAFVPDRLVETAVSKFLNTLIDRPDIKAAMAEVDMNDIPFSEDGPALVYSRDDLLEHDTDTDGVPATADGPYVPLDVAFEEHEREADKDLGNFHTEPVTYGPGGRASIHNFVENAAIDQTHNEPSSNFGVLGNPKHYEVAYSGRRGAGRPVTWADWADLGNTQRECAYRASSAGRVVGRVAIGGYDVVSPQPDIYAEAARHLNPPLTINEDAHGHNESTEITLDEWAKR